MQTVIFDLLCFTAFVIFHEEEAKLIHHLFEKNEKKEANKEQNKKMLNKRKTSSHGVARKQETFLEECLKLITCMN